MPNIFKVILDNNIIISHLMTNRGNIIDDIVGLVIAKKIQIYISTPILNELKIALQYPKIKSKLLTNKTAKFMAWYKYNSQ